MSDPHGSNFLRRPEVVEAIFAHVCRQFPEIAAQASAFRSELEEVVEALAPIDHEGDDLHAVSTATARVERFAMGQETSADRAGMRRACQAYIRSAGEVPFDRCMKLRSPMKQRNEKRDAELRKAAKLLPSMSKRKLRQTLLALWLKFVKEIYPAWVGDGAPPDDADQLHIALFHATRYARGEGPMSESTIKRALGQVCD